jgi:subtilase family serine protease
VLGDPGPGYEYLIDLPAGVQGRNLPDVSLNADPYSGYLVYFEGQWGAGNGGTSFVAPQLNGIFTLIAAGKNSRLGLLHPQLYGAFKTYGYGGASPFRAITAGTNLYYKSTNTFNPATGLGSLDVTNLARALGVNL